MTLAPGEAERLQAGLVRGFIRWLGKASPGAQVFSASGLDAAIVPASKSRSIMNSVFAREQAALASSYDELAQAFTNAGIMAWTVWIHSEDGESRRFLEEQGHLNDGAPVAMTLDLREWEGENISELDWDAEASFAELGRINDLAYGYEAEAGMAPGMTAAAGEHPIRLYRARSGGEVAAVLGILDVGDDAGVLFVATLPEMRGRGLATRHPRP